ncbi:MAG: carbohydrate-binding protein [Verrucomicrobiae bacterium]|nr:carbohydrate-binding protein [Verrucomicrobiae bacterium]
MGGSRSGFLGPTDWLMWRRHDTFLFSRMLGALCVWVTACGVFAGNSLHTTWLWHLHQPIYWPDRRASGPDHYEAAWDTIQRQDAGRPHPSPEVLRNIFGLDDRVNAYQSRPRDALGDIASHLKSGAQMSFSGALIENVQSLGAAGQLGYSSTWYLANQTARGWTTSGGKPRLDLVHFTYHHALAPLLSEETLEMELRIHRRQMEIFWNTNVAPLSRGYFPTETCFSRRMIPVLRRVGIEWAIVANTHLARACADFPVVTGSAGEMCDLPNRADQLNPAQGTNNYRRVTIERGCSPTQVMPFGFQPHWARYVDPETGTESRLIIVPSDQALGWRDSYSPWDLNLLNPLAARNDPARPALVVLAHDGDNAWSGGYSYYREWVKQLADGVASRGYEPTTIEQFLADHPPPTNAVVHVEDGGWVYADGDFGSPIFINWHWPPSYNSGGVNVVDPSTGVSDKADTWRVIIATENRVKTAQQVAGITPRVDQVRDPWSFGQTPNAVELGWHYYLGGLDSGFVYYGCHGDMCHRAVIAQSNALRHVNAILAANPNADATPPTVFLPQRHPWNPGGTNFGSQYSYRVTVATNTDFWVWTYAYDVSGVTNVRLHLRLNGTNPPTSDQFETYAGGPLTGAWQSSNMTRRVVAPVLGVTPQYIADYFLVRVRGITNSFVDYYVSATDGRGNTFKSPIQHVWVGAPAATSGGGTPGNTNGCQGRVCVSPSLPVQGELVTILYDPTGGPLAGAGTVRIHLGWNNWSSVVNPDPVMTFDPASNRWTFTTVVPGAATQLDCVFNNGSGLWDNNNGQDWHFPVATNPASTNLPPFSINGAVDSTNLLVVASGLKLYAAVRGSQLYVATASPGNSGPNDHFIFVSDALLAGATANAPWAKSGKIAVATTKPYLASESQNTYIAWYNAPPGAQAAKSASTAGVMEGTLDLVAAFGGMPTNVYLCAAAYQTADGGGLAGQAPSGSGPDIEPGEFFVIPVVALRDHNGDGVFDRLDPALDFRLLGPERLGDAMRVRWTTMPGRRYQVFWSGDGPTGWNALPESLMTAGVLQVEAVFDVPILTTVGQRFFRAGLLPGP